MTHPQDHTRFIVGCVTVLASLAALEGGWLLWKGFAGGGELVITLNTAISGLVGFLGGRRSSTPAPDTTTTATSSPEGTTELTTSTLPDKPETTKP